jgi:class I fructose-bisphosphate aldolase
MLPIDSSPISRNGKILILAYDHGLEHGPIDFTNLPETMDPEWRFDLACHDAVTALAVQKGIAEAYYPSYKNDVNLLAKINGTSNLWTGEPNSSVNWSVDYAVELGASAIGFTLYGGSNHEIEMAEEFRSAQEQARSHGIPIVMWSYPRGQGIQEKFNGNDTADEVIAYASRLALELGADVAKIKYPGSEAAMRWAVQAAGPVKVVLSGGSKVDDLTFLTSVQIVMDAGGSGLAVGRNVWQRDNANEMLDALGRIVHDGESAEDALSSLT